MEHVTILSLCCVLSPPCSPARHSLQGRWAWALTRQSFECVCICRYPGIRVRVWAWVWGVGVLSRLINWLILFVYFRIKCCWGWYIIITAAPTLSLSLSSASHAARGWYRKGKQIKSYRWYFPPTTRSALPLFLFFCRSVSSYLLCLVAIFFSFSGCLGAGIGWSGRWSWAKNAPVVWLCYLSTAFSARLLPGNKHTRGKKCNRGKINKGYTNETVTTNTRAKTQSDCKKKPIWPYALYLLGEGSAKNSQPYQISTPLKRDTAGTLW